MHSHLLSSVADAFQVHVQTHLKVRRLPHSLHHLQTHHHFMALHTDGDNMHKVMGVEMRVRNIPWADVTC